MTIKYKLAELKTRVIAKSLAYGGGRNGDPHRAPATAMRTLTQCVSPGLST